MAEQPIAAPASPSLPPPVPHPVPAPPAAPPRPIAAVSNNAPAIIPTVTRPDGTKLVPHAFELCQVDDLIVLISSMLDRLITHNDRIPLTPTSLTRFHSRAPPSISVCDYLSRIARYTNVEPAVLLVLLPYVDKVCSRWTTFTISSLSVHRFVIAGVSVGSKALSDSFCTNGRYARVGGISVAEMNLLEKEFCEAIDWRLTIQGAVLSHYYTSLVTQHPLYVLSPAPVTPVPISSPTSSAPLAALPSAPLNHPFATPPHTTAPSTSSSSASPSSSSSRSSLSPHPRGRSPSLIPPNPNVLKARLATASNLPSPVRPPHFNSKSGPGRGSLERLGKKLAKEEERTRDVSMNPSDSEEDGMDVEMDGEDNGRRGEEPG